MWNAKAIWEIGAPVYKFYEFGKTIISGDSNISVEGPCETEEVLKSGMKVYFSMKFRVLPRLVVATASKYSFCTIFWKQCILIIGKPVERRV